MPPYPIRLLCTLTPKPRTSTTARPVTASGRAAMCAPKISSNARNCRDISSATAVTVRMLVVTQAAPRLLPPTKRKITTNVLTPVNARTYATAAATRRRRTHSCRHTYQHSTRARSRTSVASASSLALTLRIYPSMSELIRRCGRTDALMPGAPSSQTAGGRTSRGTSVAQDTARSCWKRAARSTRAIGRAFGVRSRSGIAATETWARAKVGGRVGVE